MQKKKRFVGDERKVKNTQKTKVIISYLSQSGCCQEM